MLDYDTTIKFYWALMLAESNVVHRIGERVIRGTSMEKNSRF